MEGTWSLYLTKVTEATNAVKVNPGSEANLVRPIDEAGIDNDRGVSIIELMGHSLPKNRAPNSFDCEWRMRRTALRLGDLFGQCLDLTAEIAGKNPEVDAEQPVRRVLAASRAQLRVAARKSAELGEELLCAHRLGEHREVVGNGVVVLLD